MEFFEVIIFILVIIAILYKNIQKENERARKRNITKPIAVETVSPNEEPNSENTETPPSCPEYEQRQMTPDYSSQNITTNSYTQSQYTARKKYKKEKKQDKETEKYRNRKNTMSANIKLNTAEEARRAFIYSEIFNRKY